jgi:hypothetical protein
VPRSGQRGGGASGQATDDGGSALPAKSLPRGGGAIRGMGEKFAANPVTGTGSLNVPIYTSPGRSGFGPQLSLSYDSGAGSAPRGCRSSGSSESAAFRRCRRTRQAEKGYCRRARVGFR